MKLVDLSLFVSLESEQRDQGVGQILSDLRVDLGLPEGDHGSGKGELREFWQMRVQTLVALVHNGAERSEDSIQFNHGRTEACPLRSND